MNSTLHVSATDDKGVVVQPSRSVTFGSTSAWQTWMNQNDRIHLKKGVNLITLEHGASDTGEIHLDGLMLDKNRLADIDTLLIQNGDFESGNIQAGQNGIQQVRDYAKYGVDSYDAYKGKYKLYFWDTKAYKQSMHQKLIGLRTGTYTVSAWVKETLYGSKPTTVRMELRGYGTKTVYRNISPTKGYQRIQATVNVTNGSLDMASMWIHRV